MLCIYDSTLKLLHKNTFKNNQQMVNIAQIKHHLTEKDD